jgi:hypothetical protein
MRSSASPLKENPFVLETQRGLVLTELRLTPAVASHGEWGAGSDLCDRGYIARESSSVPSFSEDFEIESESAPRPDMLERVGVAGFEHGI